MEIFFAKEERYSKKEFSAGKYENVGYFNEEDYFIPFFNYFLIIFENKIFREMERLPTSHVDKKTLFQSLMTNYKKNIYLLASKTIIHEFHQFFDEFNEQDEAFYYNEFNDLLKDPLFIDNLLEKYSVLHELIQSMTDNFVQYTMSILKHYETDYEQIEVLFNRQFGSLKTIMIDIGDAHCKGKSVALVKCEFGQLIYKPRSLRSDTLYKEIVTHFNNTHKTTLKVAESFNRENYGWQEYIEQLPCQKLEDVSNYYYELGMHLGFVYLFGGSDFHYENIIANGAKAVLIDLETLFQGTFDFTGSGEKSMELQVSDFIKKTVYKSTFFANTTSSEEKSSLLIGGIANIENQEIELEQIINIGTDKISVKKVSVKMTPGKNLPIYDGEISEVFPYSKIFIEGFEKVYESVRLDSAHIVYLIEQYHHFPIRIIVRPTYIYAQFLKSLLNPTYLMQTEERYRILSFFKDSYVGFKNFKGITSFEINDLYKGDVPYFYTFSDSTAVYSSTGEVVSCNLLLCSPEEETLNRIKNLSEKDLFYQKGLINMSLSATFSNLNLKIDADSNEQQFGIQAQTDSIIETETTKIINECIPLNKHAQWISLSLSLDGKMVSGPVSFGLYDGLSGIGIYLTAYHKRSGQNFIEHLIGKITSTVDYILERSMYKDNLSAYYGVSSYIYYVEHLRRQQLIDNDSAKSHYRDFSNKVIQEVNRFDKIDFIGGLAGTLKLLVTLYRATGMEIVEEAARTVYGSIRARVHMDKKQVYWTSDIVKDRVFTGFSHGITGICYALSEYFKVWQDDSELPKIIEGALQYEDTFFCKDEGGWTDNRTEAPVFPSPLWCHGSAGILLGRAKINQSLGNIICVEHIEEALNQTLKYGDRHNQGNSLCHGTMGNIDVLLEVLKTSSGHKRKNEINATIDRWMFNFRNEMSIKGWHNGVALDCSSVGFMMGKTGQLYTLLRLQEAELPSVLLLD